MAASGTKACCFFGMRRVRKGGDGMKQKFIVWGLAGAAFLVTLGITSWQNGLWSSGEPSAQPDGVAANRSIDKPNPIPKDPFQAAVPPAAAAPPPAAMAPPAAPPPAETTQSPPQPPVDNAPTQAVDSTAPDPVYEQSQDDYKQRAKLMEEIAARARSRSQ